MDEPKIKFGDKLFLYGQYMDTEKWEDYGFENPVYNTVMGYIPAGGYLVSPVKSDIVGACLPGYVVDYIMQDSLAPATPFASEDFIDVTGLLALQSPQVYGCNVWMPL